MGKILRFFFDSPKTKLAHEGGCARTLRLRRFPWSCLQNISTSFFPFPSRPDRKYWMLRLVYRLLVLFCIQFEEPYISTVCVVLPCKNVGQIFFLIISKPA